VVGVKQIAHYLMGLPDQNSAPIFRNAGTNAGMAALKGRSTVVV
jgi:hypothetical protein